MLLETDCGVLDYFDYLINVPRIKQVIDNNFLYVMTRCLALWSPNFN